jgi:hypothetical protein
VLNVVVSAVTELIQMRCLAQKAVKSIISPKKNNFLAQGGGELLCPLCSQNSAMAFLC